MGNSPSSGLAILNNTPFNITCGASIISTHLYENNVRPGEIFYRDPGAVGMTLFVVPTTENTKYTQNKCAREALDIVDGIFNIGRAVVKVADDIAGEIVLLPVRGTIEAGEKIIDVAQKLYSEDADISLKTDALYKGKDPDLKLKLEQRKANILVHTGLNIDRFNESTLSEDTFLASFSSALRTSVLQRSKVGCYAGGEGTWLVLKGGPRFLEKTKRWIAGDFVLQKSHRKTIWRLGKFTEQSGECFSEKSRDERLKGARLEPRRDLEFVKKHKYFLEQIDSCPPENPTQEPQPQIS